MYVNDLDVLVGEWSNFRGVKTITFFSFEARWLPVIPYCRRFLLLSGFVNSWACVALLTLRSSQNLRSQVQCTQRQTNVGHASVSSTWTEWLVCDDDGLCCRTRTTISPLQHHVSKTTHQEIIIYGWLFLLLPTERKATTPFTLE